MSSGFDKYLNSKLDDLFKVSFDDKETRQLELGQVAEFIFSKITSRNFRQNKISKETIEDIKNKIELSIRENKPLYFMFLFGGYKNHRITPHHPNIGWAEIFHIMYASKLFAPILKAYKPGAIYDFSSEDVAVTVNNNHTQEDVNAYNKTLNNTISYFKNEYFPDNFEMKVTRMRDRINTDLLFYRTGRKVEAKMEDLKKIDKKELDEMLERTLYNIKLDGYVDYTKYSKDELYDVALESLAINQVYIDEDVEFSDAYLMGDNHIPMIGSYCGPDENPDGWLTINSCARSKNAFWTSKGIARKTQDKYDLDIISANSIKNIKSKIIQEKSNLFSNLTNNLDSIDVVIS